MTSSGGPMARKNPSSPANPHLDCVDAGRIRALNNAPIGPVAAIANATTDNASQNFSYGRRK